MGMSLGQTQDRFFLLLRVGGLAAILIGGGLLVLENRGVSAGWSPSVFLAAGVYLSAHLLRSVRLVSIAARPARPIRQIVLLHFYTAAISLVLPFKAGEVFRIAELSAYTRSLKDGGTIYWVERANDAVMLLGALVVLVLFSAASMSDFWPLAVFLLLFSLVTIGIFSVLPENLKRLKVFTLRKYSGDKAYLILNALVIAEKIARAGKTMIANKASTLLVLSLAIWALEVTTIYLLLPVDGILAAMSALVTQLTQVAGGPGQSLEAAPMEGVFQIVSYFALTVAVLVPTGLVAGLFYTLTAQEPAAPRMAMSWGER